MTSKKIVAPVAVRSDAEISEDLLNAWKMDPHVPEERLQVRVQKGQLTLSGTVNWNAQRDAAEPCAKRIKDVHGITNKIDVEPTVSATESW